MKNLLQGLNLSEVENKKDFQVMQNIKNFALLGEKYVEGKITFEDFLQGVRNKQIDLNSPYIPSFHSFLYNKNKQKAINITNTLWEVLYKICPKEEQKKLSIFIDIQKDLSESLIQKTKAFKYFYFNATSDFSNIPFIEKIEKDPKVKVNDSLSLNFSVVPYQALFEEEMKTPKIERLIKQLDKRELVYFMDFMITRYNSNVQKFLDETTNENREIFLKVYSTNFLELLNIHDQQGGLYFDSFLQMPQYVEVYKNNKFIHQKLSLTVKEFDENSSYTNRKPDCLDVKNNRFDFIQDKFKIENVGLVGLVYASTYYALMQYLVREDDKEFWTKDWHKSIKRNPSIALVNGLYGMNLLKKLDIDAKDVKIYKFKNKKEDIFGFLINLYEHSVTQKNEEVESRKILPLIEQLILETPLLFKSKFSTVNNLKFKNILEGYYLKAINLNEKSSKKVFL